MNFEDLGRPIEDEEEETQQSQTGETNTVIIINGAYTTKVPFFFSFSF